MKARKYFIAGTLSLISFSAYGAAAKHFIGDGDVADFAIDQSENLAVLYLAHKPTNEPFSGAKVTLQEETGKQVEFKETENKGVYSAQFEAALSGKQILIESSNDTDAIEVKEPVELSKTNTQLPPEPSRDLSRILYFVGGLFLGTLFTYLFFRRQKNAALTGVLATVFLFSHSNSASAHEGHEHGPVPGAESVDAGSDVVLAKKSQFLIGLTSVRASKEKSREALSSYGHIVPKPQFDAVISSPQAGFVRGISGLSLKRHIKKGEVLGYVDAVSEIPLRSPIDGQIIEIDAVDGGRVDAGAKLFRITNTSKVWVDAELYPTDLVKTRDATSASVVVEGLGQSFPARFLGATTAISEETRTAKVYLELDNPKDEIRIGSIANISFALKGELEEIAVPTSAILSRAGDQVVFVQVGPESFSARDVATAPSSQPGKVRIVKGVNEGDRVVISGNYQLLMKAK